MSGEPRTRPRPSPPAGPIEPRRAPIALDRAGWLKLIGFYAALAIVFTWPLFAAPWRLAAGEFFDVWGTLWTGDWLRQSLLVERQSPFFSTVTGYPFGIPIRLLDSWIWAVASLPLTTLLGNALGLNVFILGSLVFSGCSLYWLVRDAGVSHRGALVAGSLFVASACGSALFNEGAVYLLMAGWIPLSVMFALRVLDGRGRRAWLWGGICLAMSAFTSGYTGVSAAVSCTLVVLASLPRLRSPRVIAQLVLMATVGLLGVSPIVIANRTVFTGERFAMDRLVIDADGRTRREHMDWMANVPRDAAAVSSFFVPPGLTRSETPSPRERTSYLGFLPLLLAALGVVRLRWRQRVVWGVLLLASILLLLGPVLMWRSPGFGVPVPEEPALPMAWVYYLVPGAKVFRFPYRFLFITLMALAVPLGAGLDLVRRRFSSVVGVAVMVALVAEVVLIAGGPVPKPVHRLDPPEVYRVIRQNPSQGAVLEVGNPDLRWKARRLYWQTIHDRPIPDEFPVYIDLPPSALFHAMVSQRLSFAESEGAEGLSADEFTELMRRLRFDWIVHHVYSFADDDALRGPERRRWTDTLTQVLTDDFGPPQQFGNGIALYRVSTDDVVETRLLPRPSNSEWDRMISGRFALVLQAMLDRADGVWVEDAREPGVVPGEIGVESDTRAYRPDLLDPTPGADSGRHPPEGRQPEPPPGAVVPPGDAVEVLPDPSEDRAPPDRSPPDRSPGPRDGPAPAPGDPGEAPAPPPSTGGG